MLGLFPRPRNNGATQIGLKEQSDSKNDLMKEGPLSSMSATDGDPIGSDQYEKTLPLVLNGSEHPIPPRALALTLAAHSRINFSKENGTSLRKLFFSCASSSSGYISDSRDRA
jgi:hypothetical protein